MVCTSGCNKDQNNGGNNSGGSGGGNDGGSNPTTEGVYLGIIGFNETLHQKDISILNNSTKSSFNGFINGLSSAAGTALYYADYTALNKLQSYPEPPALKKVALVTFTDGLDNLSTSGSIMNPEGYGSIAAYRTALHDKIMNDKVHGKTITAYTIGLRGADVQNNLAEFQLNLEMLASRPQEDYVFEVTDMSEALERFREIAEDLYYSVTTVNLKLKLPGGLDDGLVVRFTFDDITEGGSSAKYIQCTYKRTADNGRRLENISYYGFNVGASLLDPVSQTETGTFHWFEFEDLTHLNGNPITQYDIDRLQLWKKQGTVWQRDSEFTPGSSSEVTETKSSAMIMLVLDCTTSLGSDFNTMKTGAVRFVETLCNSNVGGNGSYTPSVSTFDVIDTDYTSAKSGGTVSISGGSSVTARGVCWSTKPYPTVDDYYTNDGVGEGSFTSTITGLIHSTKYYVRAYATNSEGVTAYGAQKTFTISMPSPVIGVINGLFSVSDTQKVYFSQGNLQYQASTNTWKFATNQWDYVGGTMWGNHYGNVSGSSNDSISPTCQGWIDLFGWGTSGWDCGNTYYHPWDSDDSDGGLYGPPMYNNMEVDYAYSDWGYYNRISNGGNTMYQWRTLTCLEWDYVFNTRNTLSGIRYVKAIVNGVNGVILLPDDWDTDTFILSNANTPEASYSSNNISSSQWTALEGVGAVFLPAAGSRFGTTFSGSATNVAYWSASQGGGHGEEGISVSFWENSGSALCGGGRYVGKSVRLVCPANLL